MYRFRRVLGIALLLALSSMPASAVCGWLAPLCSLFAQDETDGRCGLDPWGCLADPTIEPHGRRLPSTTTTIAAAAPKQEHLRTSRPPMQLTGVFHQASADIGCHIDPHGVGCPTK
jgi:hypothetical protein